jgi:hypothetical protein
MDPHQPLRADDRLRSIPGETLKEQNDESLFDTVDRVRARAKNVRGSDNAGFDTPSELLRSARIWSKLSATAAMHERWRAAREQRQTGSCDGSG